jgi:hypothetical protein
MGVATTDHLPASLIAAYLDDLFAMHPYLAVKAGLHAYDGRVADWSASAIAQRLAQLQRHQAMLAPLAAEPLHLRPDAQGVPRLLPEEEARWDARLALFHARGERFLWETWRPHLTNPLIYVALLDLSGYLKRPYAPLTERLAALVRHCAAIPDVINVARHHLRLPIARSLLQQSIATYEGLLHFHTVDLVAVMQQTTDPSLLTAFTRANRGASLAYRGFIAALRALLPTATGDVALGAAHLQGLLATGEMIDLSLADLLAMGEADLAQNHAEIVATAAQWGTTPEEAMSALGRNHPPLETILDRTRIITDENRQFVIDHDLVTVWDDAQCLVQETQPHMRNGSAFMDVPGPFEPPGMEAYFYLTMPDPAWAAPQKEAWLAKQSIPGLANTSVHEAWPGHFLQFLHLQHAPTTASKIFTCTSFIEGWAHYAEQMVLEHGYHADEPHYRLQQLSMALLRDCRFLVALHLHTGQMTVDEAARFITREAFFTPIRAQQEALRGARSPGYLNYTLGKLLLLQLRADLRQRAPGWSAKTLHDALLSLGGPPIPLLREALFSAFP